MSFLSRTFQTTETPDIHVGILMAVFNGGRFLSEQLGSIEAQNHRGWHLLVSDDGSSDDSPGILSAFRPENRVTLLNGPGEGLARNFLSLLRAAPQCLPDGSWLSFADQDDVWLPDRLSRGIAALGDVPHDVPALYFSNRWVADESLAIRGVSKTMFRQPGFRNALIQNIAPGNTILLNPAAARLVCDAAAEVDDIGMHDWWVYLLIAGAGGVVVNDEEPTVLYRQHRGNALGEARSLRGGLRRFGWVMNGRYQKWVGANADALVSSMSRLTEPNRAALSEFRALRGRGAFSRIIAFRKSRLYGQTRFSTWAIWLVAAMGKL